MGIGLVWLLTPLSCEASIQGCVAMPLAWCFWIAVLTFAFLGLRALWRKALFRVSRRLWFILLLLSVVPAAGITVLLTVLGWMVLGGQASRLILAEIQTRQAVLIQASKAATTQEASQMGRTQGRLRVLQVPTLPQGIGASFSGLVYETQEEDGDHELTLRSVAKTPEGFRVLVLPLDKLQERGQTLWGGRIHYHLAYRKPRTNDMEPLTWSVGPPLEGSFLFTPFRLPDVGLKVVDWGSGRSLDLTATPETSLLELFGGYGLVNNLKGVATDRFMRQLAPAIALLVFLALVQGMAMVLGFLLTTGLGSAINQLYVGVQRLAKGDFKARLHPRSQDQVSQLARAFNDLAARLDKAEDERGERLRLEEELRVAREVQMRLLPDVSRLTSSIRAAILPAREVAGDYFDVLPLRDGRFAFLIADVSGKGTSAAFYAAETKGILSALDKEALGPQEVLARMNTLWRHSNPRSLFMTAVYGTFDPHDGACAFVRAGHPAAFLRRADASVERLVPRGLGIGLAPMPDPTSWEIWEGHLEPGDALLFYTDGLTEALDPTDALYGEERLAACLAEPLTDLPAHVLTSVQAFTQGRPLEDDLTLLLLKR